MYRTSQRRQTEAKYHTSKQCHIENSGILRIHLSTAIYIDKSYVVIDIARISFSNIASQLAIYIKNYIIPAVYYNVLPITCLHTYFVNK